MTMRNLAIWGVIVLALVAIFGVLNSGGRGASARQVTYSEMLSRVDSGDIKSVKIHGQTLEAKDRQGATLSTIGPVDTQDLEKRLEAHGANFEFEQPGAGLIPTILINMLPILLLIGVWVFFMRQMQGGARGAMGFGKSKAKQLTENKNRVTFDDVAGVDEAKEDLT